VDAQTLEYIRKDIDECGFAIISNFLTPGMCQFITVGFSSKDIAEITMSTKLPPSVSAEVFKLICQSWEEAHVSFRHVYSLDGLVPENGLFKHYYLEMVENAGLGRLVEVHEQLYPNSYRVLNIVFSDLNGVFEGELNYVKHIEQPIFKTVHLH
jgi:hypothetical protein